MLRVRVIDPAKGTFLREGTTDGKLIDMAYFRVDGQLVPAVYCWPVGDLGDYAQEMFSRHARERKELNERLDKEAYTFFNNHSALDRFKGGK